jgi:hypothetical protein
MGLADGVHRRSCRDQCLRNHLAAVDSVEGLRWAPTDELVRTAGFDEQYLIHECAERLAADRHHSE